MPHEMITGLLLPIPKVYLHHRLGPAEGHSLLGSLLATVDRVNSFSARLREFLADVTRSGLQASLCNVQGYSYSQTITY